MSMSATNDVCKQLIMRFINARKKNRLQMSQVSERESHKILTLLQNLDQSKAKSFCKQISVTLWNHPSESHCLSSYLAVVTMRVLYAQRRGPLEKRQKIFINFDKQMSNDNNKTLQCRVVTVNPNSVKCNIPNGGKLTIAGPQAKNLQLGDVVSLSMPAKQSTTLTKKNNKSQSQKHATKIPKGVGSTFTTTSDNQNSKVKSEQPFKKSSHDKM